SSATEMASPAFWSPARTPPPTIASTGSPVRRFRQDIAWWSPRPFYRRKNFGTKRWITSESQGGQPQQHEKRVGTSMKFAFIHIRKAGGTALKHVFRSALKGHDDASPVRLYEHQMTLEKLWASRPE